MKEGGGSMKFFIYNTNKEIAAQIENLYLSN